MKYKKIADMVYELTESAENESAKIILFQLFPGISLGINYVNIHRIVGDNSDYEGMDQLRINYCFEGRCEVKLTDGRYVYVDNDVLCIEDHAPQYNFYYPIGFYRGIQIFIDKKELQKHSYEAFDLFGIHPSKIIDKYANKDKTFIQIASDVFAEKSAEIVSIWENENLVIESKIHQLRFALCQLFYYLINEQAVNKEKPYNASTLSHGQYMIALDCEKRITTDLSKKLTIESIAANYKISPSSLKKFFRFVYGCSISEYTQTMRMKEAARLLTTQDLSVMQVAASVGYENQSKFSAVFKKHTGYAPLEYKRIQILKRNEDKK